MINKLRRRVERHVIAGFLASIGPGPITDALAAKAEVYVSRDTWSPPRDHTGVLAEY